MTRKFQPSKKEKEKNFFILKGIFFPKIVQFIPKILQKGFFFSPPLKTKKSPRKDLKETRKKQEKFGFKKRKEKIEGKTRKKGKA